MNSEKSHFGGLAVGGVPTIYIKNKDVLDPQGNCNDCDMDEWDESVISHEFSHFLVWLFGQSSPHAYGPHDGISPVKDIFTQIDTVWGIDLAYNEALASAIGGALRANSVYTDSVHGFAVSSYGVDIDLEKPKPDGPWVTNRANGMDLLPL